MAWRLEQQVTRGEIDNRMRGHVTGRIWLANTTEPLILELRGDFHPDIAGCFLTFENPTPVPLTTRPPMTMQRGNVGAITAARKVRVFDLPLANALAMLKEGVQPPSHLANCLYLEWFSLRSGRMVIESADYRLTVSEPLWQFTAAEIKAFNCQPDAPFIVEISAQDSDENWDEFRAEQLLRECDARSERYRQLLEKYRDHPDNEQIIAHEMGWTENKKPSRAIEDETWEDDTIHDLDPGESLPLPEPECDPAREGIDWVLNQHGEIAHPIQNRASLALHALLDELRASGHFPDCPDEALQIFIGNLMTISAKLAGALTGLARDRGGLDPALTIAQLKRVLEIVHDTLASLDQIDDQVFLTGGRFASYRATLFGLREDILALANRLREER
jgi:hypothetical protein